MKINTLLLFIVLLGISGCDIKKTHNQCDLKSFKESKMVVVSDDEHRFSIKIPDSWDFKKKHDDQSSEILIKAACGTTILISSRQLDARELAAGNEALINAMINGSLKQIKDSGHTVINYGKYPSISYGYPAFTVVSHDPKRKYPDIQIGALSQDKVLSIIAIGNDKFDSDVPAKILKATLESVKLN